MIMQGISPQKKKMVYTRNFTNRLIHWITFFAVITLMITGYYIGNPSLVYGQGEAYQTTVMADIRLIHFYAAMVLDVTLMVWLYLAFFSRFDRYWKRMLPTVETFREAWPVLRCYFTFKKPPFYRHFDPFDGLLFFLLVGLMAFQLLSGLHLFAHAHPPDYWWAQVIHMSTDWLVWLLGGTQQVRLYHHMVEWIMIAGVIFHVYLQVAKTVIWQDGHIGQMFGGYKYKDVD